MEAFLPLATATSRIVTSDEARKDCDSAHRHRDPGQKVVVAVEWSVVEESRAHISFPAALPSESRHQTRPTTTA